MEKKRTFRNISGKKINVLTKAREPNEVFTAMVPGSMTGRQNEQLWIVSKRQEIDNLIKYGFILEGPEIEKEDSIKAAASYPGQTKISA